MPLPFQERGVLFSFAKFRQLMKTFTHHARGEVARQNGSLAVGFLFAGQGEMDAQFSLGCWREVSAACRKHGQGTITTPDETMPA
jgi:hypothetical protein